MCEIKAIDFGTVSELTDCSVQRFNIFVTRPCVLAALKFDCLQKCGKIKFENIE